MKRIGIILIMLLVGAAVGVRAQDRAKTANAGPSAETIAQEYISEACDAIARHDAVGALQALLKIDDFKIGLSFEPATVKDILAVSHKASETFADSPIYGLFLLYEATVFDRIYDGQSSKYNRREAPLLPYPEDFTEWTGQQFKHKIKQLVGQAITGESARRLNQQYTTDYLDIIRISPELLPYYPTLLYFAYSYVWNAFDKNVFSPYLSGALAITPEGSPESMPLIAIEFWKNYDLEWFKGVFEKYSTDPYAGYLLMEIFKVRDYSLIMMDYDRLAFDKWYYKNATEYLSRFPNALLKKRIANDLLKVSVPTVRCEFPEYCAPNTDVPLRIKAKNAEQVKIDIYKSSEDADEDDESRASKLRLVESNKDRVVSISFKIDSVEPYVLDTLINVRLKEKGVYKVHVSSGTVPADNRPDVIRCITMFPIAVNEVDNPHVMVLDPANGAPIKGANVEIVDNDEVLEPKYITNANGVADLKEFDELYCTLSVKNRGEKMLLEDIEIRRSEADATERKKYSILTDKALYHFGDSVHVLVVGFDYTRDASGKMSAGVAQNDTIHLVVEDTHRKAVHNAECTGDEFGRYILDFRLPDDGMSGEYTIFVKEDEYDYPRKEITVSDFKLPQFEVQLDAPRRGVPASGDVTFSGTVTTYSCMPIANTDVDVIISKASWWRWTYGNEKIFSTSTTTDAGGAFALVLPDSVLSRHGTCFAADFTLTDASGNMIDARVPFNTGKPYIIDFAAYRLQADANEPYTPKVKVLAPGDVPVEIPLRWSLDDEKGYRLEGDFTGSVDFRDVRPGMYTFAIGAIDPALADSVEIDLCIYNPDTDIVPGVENLWVLTRAISNGNKQEILFGVKNDGSYVHFVAIDPVKMTLMRTVKVDKGYHTLTVDDVDDGITKVHVFAIDNCKYVGYDIDIDSRKPRELKIEGSAFRDRLTPGASETWNITVKNSSDKAVESAVALDMYAKALDDITPHKFRLNTRNPLHFIYGELEMLDNDTKRSYSFGRVDLDRYKLMFPDFKFANEISSLSYLGNDDVVVKGYGASSGYMDKSMEFDSMELSEVVTLTEKKEEVLPGDGPEDSFDYRDSEVTLGLWQPNLSTDANGDLKYTFTVPNANTTWRLQAVAWTKEAYAGNLVRDFVASKPVMVQPNLPRFLRVDDKAMVLASVMNNTDSVATINTVVEIFNPYTSQIIDRREYTNVLDGKAIATVGMDISACGDLDAIGYRVRSSDGKFSDGEQAVIRILPNENALIESMPFYLNPGETEYSTILPKDRDARLSLTFCENPAWTIVTALPGLRSDISDYANSAAAALFSACVARGIVKENPAIGKAIKAWQENPTDSALVSMLEKNEDLKIALLNSTPWVQAAQSDTERMANLMLLFDEKETDASIKKALDILVDLQQKDGGWKWGKWCDKSSEWVTSNVMCMLCQLHEFGWLPDDSRIEQMIANALRYWDGIVDDTDMVYAIIRPRFDAEISDNGKAVIDKTIEEISAEWKNYPLGYRSMAAEALFVNDCKAHAVELMHSISAEGRWTPSQGLRFPGVDALYAYGNILDAYAMILPDAKEIDGLRQQLIMRKLGTNWGDAVVTTEVVQSLLMSGSNWTVDATGASINVGGENITPSTPMETATGNIRADLTPYAGETLTVTTPGASPAYGTVYAQFSQLMSDVKAAGCEDLDVEKVMFVRRGKEWIPATDLKVGDRVKVQLTVHCKRNLQYVEIIDERPAAFEPVEQLPGWVWSEGTRFYRENRDSRTMLHVQRLNPGTYLLTYEMNVSTAGTFSSGVATVQSLYAPEITAHSSGRIIEVK